MSYEPKHPVSIEDVLRLKRAERPPAEFWERFDRELRAKQLAALVEKRPWWRRLPDAFAGLARYHLPIGATAVLAITVLSVRHYQSNDDATPAIDRVPTVATKSAAESQAEVTLSPPAAEVADFIAVVTPSFAAEEPAPSAELDVVRTATEASGIEVPSTVALLGLAMNSGAQTESSLTTVPDLGTTAAEPLLAGSLLSAASMSESLAFSRSAPVEPLQQITPPAEMRRVRVLAALAVSSASQAQTRYEGRFAHRISEDRLTEEGIRRLKVGGDRVLWSF